MVGTLTQDARTVAEGEWLSEPSDTVSVAEAIALAFVATFSAAPVVTVGVVSTNVTSAVAGDSVRAASSTTSWKLSGATVWPATAGVTSKDVVSASSPTLAFRPTLSDRSTSSVATSSTVVGSVTTTAATSLEETSEVA